MQESKCQRILHESDESTRNVQEVIGGRNTLPESAPAREALAEVLERGGLLNELLHLLFDGKGHVGIEVASSELGFDTAVYGKCTAVAALGRLCSTPSVSYIDDENEQVLTLEDLVLVRLDFAHGTLGIGCRPGKLCLPTCFAPCTDQSDNQH